MNMVNTTYNSTEVMIDKLQELKGKEKLKFYKKVSNYYDEMNVRNFIFEEDPSSENSQGISKIYNEVLRLLSFSQTKLQVKNMNIKYFDFYYTVVLSSNEKEIVDDQYETNENDYINFNDFITPNHYIGIKNDMHC